MHLSDVLVELWEVAGKIFGRSGSFFKVSCCYIFVCTKVWYGQIRGGDLCNRFASVHHRWLPSVDEDISSCLRRSLHESRRSAKISVFDSMWSSLEVIDLVE